MRTLKNWGLLVRHGGKALPFGFFGGAMIRSASFVQQRTEKKGKRLENMIRTELVGKYFGV
jgi:hypothetical protein